MVYTRIVQPGARRKYMYTPGEPTIFRVSGTIIPKVWPVMLMTMALTIALCFVYDPVRRAEKNGVPLGKGQKLLLCVFGNQPLATARRASGVFCGLPSRDRMRGGPHRSSNRAAAPGTCSTTWSACSRTSPASWCVHLLARPAVESGVMPSTRPTVAIRGCASFLLCADLYSRLLQLDRLFALVEDARALR